VVKVISYPYYQLPQELCLSFECFEEEDNTEKVYSTWLPSDEVAHDFLVLLSLFAREALIPLGLRREDNEPTSGEPQRLFPSPSRRFPAPIPCGVDSNEFCAIIVGLAKSEDPRVEAVLGASKFYHVGLSLAEFDSSLAYLSFVSAIECLAGHYYKGAKFDFDSVPKFEKAKATLGLISACNDAAPHVAQLKEDLLEGEHFVRQKFLRFLSEFVTASFWTHDDELYPKTSDTLAVTRENYDQCLKEIYTARSSFIHSGEPLPEYVAAGLRERVRPQALGQLLALRGKTRFIPFLTWFERLCHATIIEFMRRHVAPELADSDAKRRAEHERLLKEIADLPEATRGSLIKLVQWTAGFLRYAVICPYAKNSEWADSAESVALLKRVGIIGGNGNGLEGESWLRNRNVGETAGEFVFGAARNPFLGNEILLPPGLEE
jgi:hypothetical protein